MNDQSIKWEINANQANYIFNVLAQRPYSEVFELMATLQQQSQQQAPQNNQGQPPAGEPPKPQK